uniref:Ig-like domain-containing protein n=1 Tax=Amphiprion percula TaxID=161767 RepID=A0A3P8RLP4_AMPPE
MVSAWEGDYTCYAENQLGKDEMKVRIKVKVATYPPQVQGKDQRTVRVFYGETVTLGCNTKGEPLPLITWISPTNKVISPALDKYQILDDGTLVVQKAQRFDGGNYTCMARNSAGQDHKVTRLEVLVTPPVINGNVILPAPYYSNRMAVHLNGTLEIRSPKTTDSGQLACIARNEGGETRIQLFMISELYGSMSFNKPLNSNFPKYVSGFSVTVSKNGPYFPVCFVSVV